MGVTRCRDCGQTVSDRVNYCPHCGGPMHDAEPVSDTHATTPQHQYPPQQQYPPRQQQSYHTPGQPRRGNNSGVKAFFISFFAILIIGCAGFAIYYHYFMTPEAPRVVTGKLRSMANSFDELGEFYNGIAQVKRGSAIYYINTAGDIVPAPDGKHNGVHIPDEDNDLVKIEVGGRYGYINRNTRDTVIKPIYSTLGSFYDGFALATIKYGREGMPEYQCYRGYVDTRGNHTFLPEHFNALSNAQSAVKERERIDALPKGVSLYAIGLPKGVSSVHITRDSLYTWDLSFGRDGILTRYGYSTRGQVPRSYRVTAGHVSEMSYESGGTIHRFTFKRKPAGDHRENIYKIGPQTQEQVGSVSYSPTDGTTTSWRFEQLPALNSAPADSLDYDGRPVHLILGPSTYATINYY